LIVPGFRGRRGASRSHMPRRAPGECPGRHGTAGSAANQTSPEHVKGGDHARSRARRRHALHAWRSRVDRSRRYPRCNLQRGAERGGSGGGGGATVHRPSRGARRLAPRTGWPREPRRSVSVAGTTSGGPLPLPSAYVFPVAQAVPVRPHIGLREYGCSRAGCARQVTLPGASCQWHDRDRSDHESGSRSIIHRLFSKLVRLIGIDTAWMVGTWQYVLLCS
jgi:hypothetical protein